MHQHLTTRAPVASPGHPRQAGRLKVLLVIGFALLVLLAGEDLLLPWIEGAAEPALLELGPWSWLLQLGLEPPRLPPALPLALSLLLLGGLAAAYLGALAVASEIEDQRATLALVISLTTMILGVIVLAPPVRKADLFYYAFQGRMIAHAGLNPYSTPPRALEADPWFSFVSPVWRDLTTGYGPSWLLISAGLDRVLDRSGSQSELVRVVVGLRALFALSILASAALLWDILGALLPRSRSRAVVAFTWNPSVLVVGLEHNDVVMLALALGGVALHLRGRRGLAVVLLTLSAMVKYYTLPLLVVYLIWQMRDPTRSWCGRGVLPLWSLLLLLALVAPFDPFVLLAHYPIYLTESGRLNHLAQLPFELVAALCGIIVVQVAQLHRLEQLAHVLESATIALLIYLAFLSRDWFPWYLVTAIGLAAALDAGWLAGACGAGVFWLLDLHGGTTYLAALAQPMAGVPPARTLEITALGPAAVLVAVDRLGCRRRWPSRRLYLSGIAVVACLTIAAEIPLLFTWPQPPQVDLGSGRAPGARIVGTVLEWDDWSWGVRIVEVGTPAGPGGSRSLCITPRARDGAFFVHHPGFLTAGYRYLSVDVHPLNGADPHLTLQIRGSAGQPLGSTALDPYLGPAGQLPDGWRAVTIPLSAINAANATVTGVLLQFADPGPRATVCLQGLGFR